MRKNSNISRMQWTAGNDNVLRGYDFYYDGLGRLTSSHYAEGSDMSQNRERYSEKILSYSPNGSIEKLQRYGKRNNDTFGLIDDLTYSYNGNQIKAISDKAGSLLYDGSFDLKDGALEIINENYNLLFSNCAQTVQNALKNAGLNPGSGFLPKSKVYPSIVKNNKNGKKVLFYNTRTNKYYKNGK